MELTFHSQDEFESFAAIYMLGANMQRGAVDIRTVLTHQLKDGPGVTDLSPAAVAARTAREQYNDRIKRAAQPADVRLEPIPGDAEDAADLAELYADHPEALGNGDPDPQPATDDGIVHEPIDLPPAAETEQEPEKPKRKRRTKAEIEAAALAEQRTLDPAKEANDAPAFDIPEVIEHIPAEGQEKLPNVPKDAPKHQASAESIEKHATAQAEYTPELIETLKGQAELFDANRTAHLNEGREAIAKHGFIKYMATFKGLGLDSAIATYNDDQVKLHRAAIAHLMAS